MSFDVSGLSHVAIRATDLPRSRRFYAEVLGFPPVFEADDVILFQVGRSLLAVRGGAPETAQGDRFDPFRVGLDHLAFAVDDAEQLDEMQHALDRAAVPNEGVQDDPPNAKSLVFYDPDGIALEMYAVASER